MTSGRSGTHLSPPRVSQDGFCIASTIFWLEIAKIVTTALLDQSRAGPQGGFVRLPRQNSVQVFLHVFGYLQQDNSSSLQIVQAEAISKISNYNPSPEINEERLEENVRNNENSAEIPPYSQAAR